jgi:hypothetical protein
MVFGSYHEDDDNDAGGHRAHNHFYDPLAGGGGLDDWPTDTQLLMGLDSFSWGRRATALGSISQLHGTCRSEGGQHKDAQHL